MSSPEPEDFARVALVPFPWVELLAGITADAEIADLMIIRHLESNTFTVRATRDSRIIDFTVGIDVFREFVNRVQDLCS